MTAKIIARVLLAIGFLAASVGYSSWTAQRTFFDPSATRGATQALLATPSVQAMLAREIRSALKPVLGSAGADPKLSAAIDSAVTDPQFVGAFENAIMGLHEGILSGRGGQVTLDSHAVTTAINEAVARLDPAIAPKVRKVKTVSVPLGSSQLPHIGNLRHNVVLVGDTAIAIALVLVGGALVLVHDRKMFRRAGRRLAFLAAPPALVFLVVPHLLVATHNSALAVSAAILQAYGHRVLFSAAVLAVAGTGICGITVALPMRAERLAATADSPARATSVHPPDTRIPSNQPSTPVPVPEGLYL